MRFAIKVEEALIIALDAMHCWGHVQEPVFLLHVPIALVIIGQPFVSLGPIVAVGGEE